MSRDDVDVDIVDVRGPYLKVDIVGQPDHVTSNLRRKVPYAVIRFSHSKRPDLTSLTTISNTSTWSLDSGGHGICRRRPGRR